MKDIREIPAIQAFYKYTPSSLERKELGIKGFSEITDELHVVSKMIDEMISIIESYVIPDALIANLLETVTNYNNFAERIKGYDMDSDGSSNFRNRTHLIGEITTWIDSLFRSINSSNGSPNNFLITFNSLKMYQLTTLQNDKTEIEKLKGELENSLKKANELVTLLQNRATSITIHDYAAIFKEQSNKHSKFAIWPIKLGLAQVWLIVCVLLTTAFGYFIKHENDFLPFDASNPNATIISLQLLTRILVISFIIYLISFAFKQYNVQNHLSTVNQHRQNTLNSYKLFIESLDGEDGATKNALMMEVAKAIYESGPSGYLSSKDGESSPSIIEMTKYVGQSK